MKYLIIIISLFFSVATMNSQTVGDCGCDVTITAPNQSFPNPANITVCFVGNFSYNQNIVLKNGVELCVGEGVTINGNISNQNWGQPRTIHNYGTISSQGIFNDNMANSIVHNHGTFSRSINFNQGDNKQFNNYGVLNVSNLDLHSGTFRNFQDAILNVNGSMGIQSNIITQLEGLINVSNNFNINKTAAVTNAIVNVEGNVNFNSGQFNLINSQVNIVGNVVNNMTLGFRNSQLISQGNITHHTLINTLTGNECSTLNYSNINTWHAPIQSNNGILSVSFIQTQVNQGHYAGNITTEACSSSTPHPNVIQWTGTTSSDWHVAGNWSNNQIPDAKANVEIPANVINFPELFQNTSIGSIHIQSGANLTFLGRELTINKSIRVEGELKTNDFSSLNLAIQEDSYLLFDEDFNSIGNLSLTENAELQLNSPVKLFNTLNVQSGVLKTNDNLVLACAFEGNSPVSTIVKNAQVAQVTGQIEGDVTVEQCYSGRRSFRLLGSSVTTTSSIRQNWQENANSWNHNPNPGYGTHITGTGIQSANPDGLDGMNGFDWQPSGNPSMFTYNNDASNWSAVSNTTTSLEAGQAYRLMIRGSRNVDVRQNSAAPSRTKLRAKGQLHQGTFTLEYSAFDENHFVFFSNPFHTNVNLNQVLADSENIRPFFYVWDPSLAARGSFAVIDLNTQSQSPEDALISQFILPQQAGFFIASGEGPVKIVFNENAKSPTFNEIEVLSNEEAVSNSIRLTLYEKEAHDNGEKSTDGVLIKFGEGYSSGLDEFDVRKNENQDENFARLFANQLLAIESRGLPVEGEILQLFINQYKSTNYVIKANASEINGFVPVLVDNYTQQEYVLDGSEVLIDFEVDHAINQSKSFNRFRIKFETTTLSVDNFEVDNFALYPNPLSGELLTITAPNFAGENVMISVYNSLGVKVATSKEIVGSNGAITYKAADLQAGLYIVEVTSEVNAQKYTAKLLKK